ECLRKYSSDSAKLERSRCRASSTIWRCVPPTSISSVMISNFFCIGFTFDFPEQGMQLQGFRARVETALHEFLRGRHTAAAQHVIAKHAFQRLGERRGVIRLHQQAGLAIAHQL